MSSNLDLDDRLAIVYSRHAGSSSPSSIVLALLGSACRHGSCDPKPVRAAVARLSPRLHEAVSGQVWPSLVARHIALALGPAHQESSSSIQTNLGARLLALLVSDRAGSGGNGIRARALAATLLLKILETGVPGAEDFINAPLVSAGSFAVAMGASDPGMAKPWLKAALDREMIRRIGYRPGSAQAWKLPHLRTAPDWGSRAEGLGARDLEDPIAAAVIAVNHPGLVWLPVRNPHFMWAYLVAEAMDVDPTLLGLTKRTTIPLAIKELAEHGLLGLEGRALHERLDALAAQPTRVLGTTPMDRYQEAEARRREAAAVRKGQVLAARQRADEDWALVQCEASSAAIDSGEVVKTSTLPAWFTGSPEDVARLKAGLNRAGYLLLRVDQTAGTYAVEVDSFGPGPAVRGQGESNRRFRPVVRWAKQ